MIDKGERRMGYLLEAIAEEMATGTGPRKPHRLCVLLGVLAEEIVTNPDAQADLFKATESIALRYGAIS